MSRKSKETINQAVAIFAVIGGVLFSSSAFAKEHIVHMVSPNPREMLFEPKDITINAGDTITWENSTKLYHNVKSDPKGIPEGAKSFISSGLNKIGDKWSYTFTTTGKYDYFCVPHRNMGMVGSVTVEK